MEWVTASSERFIILCENSNLCKQKFTGWISATGDIPVAKPWEKGTYRKPICTWEDHIKTVTMSTRLNCKGQDVMVGSCENNDEFWCSEIGNFLTKWITINCSRKTIVILWYYCILQQMPASRQQGGAAVWAEWMPGRARSHIEGQLRWIPSQLASK